MSHFIAGEWKEGVGEPFTSQDPVTHGILWKGREARTEEVNEAVEAARSAFRGWSDLSFEERVHYVRQFEEALRESDLAHVISQETGKPLWESRQEVSSMINKVNLSIQAYQERCSAETISLGSATLKTGYKPHGTVAVLGPFNFPGHLPNGHLVPALLAGNTVVFKGSEWTPAVNEKMIRLWKSLPPGVLNLVQGRGEVGKALSIHPGIDGLFFTGSLRTGLALLDQFKHHPEKILALEMGGNNPLVVHDVADLEAAAYLTIQSAFQTAGQRCTCARRLIVLEGKEGEAFLKVLIQMANGLQVGHFQDDVEPFMGPVISLDSAEKLLTAQAYLGTQGGISLLEMRRLKENTPLLSPGIMDVTAVKHRADEEYFGPFLQVIRVPSFEAALTEANRTQYGLVASLFSQSKERYEQFYRTIHAGVINWNTATTGASSRAPFGGVGKSGNHRPSGYFATDYCSYPVASMACDEVYLPKAPTPGISFLGIS